MWIGVQPNGTLEIASEYTNRIYQNSLKTCEARKAVEVRQARGEIMALIGSDNILPERDWLSRMTAPFVDVAISSQLPSLFEIRDPQVAGSEPLYYTHRREYEVITRYCAMM